MAKSWYSRRPKKTFGQKAWKYTKRTAQVAGPVLTTLGTMYLKKKLGLNTETKYLDTASTGTLTTTLALQQNPLIIPQDTNENSRNGNTIRITGINTSILLDSVLNTAPSCMVRIVIVYSKCTNGDYPTVAEILTQNTSVLSHYTMNRTNYNIVYDKTHIMGGTTNANSLPVHKLIYFNHKPLDHHCKWSTTDTTGNRGNLLEGDYAIYAFCDGYATTAPTMTVQSRAKFVDN